MQRCGAATARCATLRMVVWRQRMPTMRALLRGIQAAPHEGLRAWQHGPLWRQWWARVDTVMHRPQHWMPRTE